MKRTSECYPRPETSLWMGGGGGGKLLTPLINSANFFLAPEVWSAVSKMTVSPDLASSGVWKQGVCCAWAPQERELPPAVLEQRPGTPSTPAPSRSSRSPLAAAFPGGPEAAAAAPYQPISTRRTARASDGQPETSERRAGPQGSSPDWASVNQRAS